MFYFPDISSGNFEIGAEETKHIVRVLRKTVGDTLEVTDGKGLLAKVEIVSVGKRSCTVCVVHEERAENRAPDLTIAIAPTKSIDRFEWFVEKAVEIGVRNIVPILCENSERKVVKNERLQKIAVSAMKQSQALHLPEIAELTPLSVLADEIRGASYVAYCPVGGADYLLPKINGDEKVTIFIGPEGDFSPHEFELLQTKGCVPVSLGNSRLRTETAGVLACSLMQAADMAKTIKV